VSYVRDNLDGPATQCESTVDEFPNLAVLLSSRAPRPGSSDANLGQPWTQIVPSHLLGLGVLGCRGWVVMAWSRILIYLSVYLSARVLSACVVCVCCLACRLSAVGCLSVYLSICLFVYFQRTLPSVQTERRSCPTEQDRIGSLHDSIVNVLAVGIKTQNRVARSGSALVLSSHPSIHLSIHPSPSPSPFSHNTRTTRNPRFWKPTLSNTYVQNFDTPDQHN